MRTSESRREARKAETRDELIFAASRVFVERGYRGASVKLVADEAGFTTGAVYGHFKNKDDLFLAVYERYARARAAELTALFSSDGDDFARSARAAAEQWSAHHAENPGFTILALEFAVHSLRHPELRDALARTHAAVREAAADALERHASAAGVSLPMPATAIATVLRELGVGLAMAQLIDASAVEPDLYANFVETFSRMALSQGDTPCPPEANDA